MAIVPLDQRCLRLDAMKIFTLHQGSEPLLISLPHDGEAIPEALFPR